MKFKPGDKVRITKKHEMEIGSSAKKNIDELGTNGIFTIKDEHPSWLNSKPHTYYRTKEFSGPKWYGTEWAWREDNLELVIIFDSLSGYIEPERIYSRFEILDL